LLRFLLGDVRFTLKSRHCYLTMPFAGEVASNLNAALVLPGSLDGVSVPYNANACMPSRTPADLADGGIAHAHTTNSLITCAA
jgi:hypothetical protein